MPARSLVLRIAENMRLVCTQLQAAFSAAQMTLRGRPPLALTLDCHDRPPFILRASPVTAEPLSEPLEAYYIRAALNLAPAGALLADLQVFAATHSLPLTAVADPAGTIRETLILAACHVAESKSFIFSEKAVLTARPTGPLAAELAVTGPFPPLPGERRHPAPGCCCHRPPVVPVLLADPGRRLRAAGPTRLEWP